MASPSPANPKYIGEELAKTIKAQLPHLHEDRPALAVRSEVVNTPLQTHTEMDLKWAKEASRGGVGGLTRYRVDRILALEKLRKKYGETLPCTVQVIRLSRETAIVTLPGEMFVEHGLAIKKASPFANTLVIELSNDREKIASVPLRKSFSEGGYEIVYSRLESGAGEMLVSAAMRLLKELKETE